MRNKFQKREKRAVRGRSKINRSRICVDRSIKHMSVQLIGLDGTVICSASTRESAIQDLCKKNKVSNFGNKAAAGVVGQIIAERALEKGVKQVAFDRAGYKYHGRVQALADAAREAGLEF